MVRGARSKADFAQWELTAMHQPWGSMFKMEWERARDVGTPVAQAVAEKELPTAQRSETARVEASANQSSSAAAFLAASSVASSAAPEAAPDASNKQAEEDESKHRMPRADQIARAARARSSRCDED